MNKIEFFTKLYALPYNTTDPTHTHDFFGSAYSNKIHTLEISVPIGPTTIAVDVPSTMQYLLLHNDSPSNDSDYMIYYYVGDSDGNAREMWLINYGVVVLPNVTPHTSGQVFFESWGKVANLHMVIVE